MHFQDAKAFAVGHSEQREWPACDEFHVLEEWEKIRLFATAIDVGLIPKAYVVLILIADVGLIPMNNVGLLLIPMTNRQLGTALAWSVKVMQWYACCICISKMLRDREQRERRADDEIHVLREWEK